MNVLLMGPRGCGKTTIGRRLATRLGVEFIDLDEVTRAAFDEADVHAIWMAHGESGWRRAEAAALVEVLGVPDRVIALGGGTPMIESARRLLERERAAGRAWIVYLRCSVDELKRRLRAAPGDRPGLTGGDPVAEVAAVLAVREPTYRALADLVLPADELAMDETAAAIEGSLQRPRTG